MRLSTRVVCEYLGAKLTGYLTNRVYSSDRWYQHAATSSSGLGLRPDRMFAYFSSFTFPFLLLSVPSCVILSFFHLECTYEYTIHEYFPGVIWLQVIRDVAPFLLRTGMILPGTLRVFRTCSLLPIEMHFVTACLVTTSRISGK